MKKMELYDPFKGITESEKIFADWMDDYKVFKFPDLPHIKIATPKISMKEKGNRLLMDVSIPGLAMDQVKVKVHGHSMSIIGSMCKEGRGKDKGGEWNVYSSESFLREIPLPKEADVHHMKTHALKGHLSIQFPLKPMKLLKSG